MGIEHNHVVLATTWNDEAANKIKEWIKEYKDPEREQDLTELFLYSKSIINGKTTVILAPDGSKEGWPLSDAGDRLRKAFISELKKSESWEWIEVGYGELGSKIYRACDMEDK